MAQMILEGIDIEAKNPSFGKFFHGVLLSSMILEELRMLAQQDLGDFFVYRIGEALAHLDNAPYGGARYSVTAFLDGKVFVRFQLDVGADAVVTRTETMRGADWLVLLAKMRSMDFEVLKEALRLVFKVRQTHSLPQKIDMPPQAWEIPYNELAKECALILSLDEAFREVEKVYSRIQA